MEGVGTWDPLGELLPGSNFSKGPGWSPQNCGREGVKYHPSASSPTRSSPLVFFLYRLLNQPPIGLGWSSPVSQKAVPCPWDSPLVFSAMSIGAWHPAAGPVGLRLLPTMPLGLPCQGPGLGGGLLCTCSLACTGVEAATCSSGCGYSSSLSWACGPLVFPARLLWPH